MTVMAHQDEMRAAVLRAETRALLQSPDFIRSPVMSQLLTYLVEEAISNPDKPPKAYHVAVDGLGRTEDFDVQADSYPRVQVGRLRKMLAAHYAARGVKERLRIPIGHYAVEIQAEDGVPSGLPPTSKPDQPDQTSAPAVVTDAGRRFGQRHMLIGLVVIFLVFAIGLFWAFGSTGSGSSNQAGVSQNFILPPKIYLSSLQQGLSQEDRDRQTAIGMFLENAFARSSQVRLAAGELSGIAPEAEQNGYRFENRLVAGPAGPEIRFSLTSLNRNETVWSASVALPDSASEYPAQLGPIVSRVASIYGVVATDQRKHLPEDAMIGHACLLRFESYRANRDPELLPVVESCVKQSLAADPMDSGVLAAASFLSYLRKEQSGNNPDPEAGLEFARRAMVRGREDAAANFALARSSFFNGSCARGKEFAKKAVQLAPYEATIHAQTGAYLFACEDPEAIGYLRHAIALDPRGSIVAETALVLTLLAEGKNREALEIAEKIVPSSTGVGPYYDVAMAMVYAKNGMIAKSRQSWNRLVDGYGRGAEEDPRALLRRLILDPALANRAYLLLSQTGVIAG